MPKASRCYCQSRERGFSLFEAIVSLALLAPLLLAGMSMLKQSSNVYQRVATHRYESAAFLRVSELLHTMLREYGQHTLALAPRVHTAGLITFTDGTSNPITTKTGTLKPSASHSAISSVNIDSLGAITVLLAQVAGAGVRYFGCTKYQGSPSATVSQFLSSAAHPAFVGLAVDGMFELAGSVKKWANASAATQCWELLLAPKKSMLVPAAPIWANAMDVRLLIPVERAYTLYVDSGDRLRYLGHYAGGNIENQPLLEHISQLELTIAVPTVLSSVDISAKMRFKSQQLWQWEQLSPVARDPSPNHLLN